jgi:uncharacterized membrane protein
MRTRLATRISWTLVCLLSLAIAAYAIAASLDVARSPGDSGPASFLIHPWLGVVHGATGAIALAVGIFQFLHAVQRRARLHRTLGWIYIISVTVSGFAGWVLAQDSGGGLTTTLGFGALALAWLVTLTRAVAAIRRRQVQRHREWMIRCFALTFAAVMLRFILPGLIFGLEIGDELSYRIVSFACWIPNLVAAEWWIRRSR